MKTLFFLLISTVCLAQNYPDPIITVNNTTKEVEVIVKREPGAKHPILTVDGFIDPCGTFFTVKNDSQFVATFKLVYADLEPDTVKILAKDFLQTGGTVADPSPFAGNLGVALQNDVVGYYNTGDWIKYSANLTGKQKIKLSYSCAHSSITRKMEVRIGSITGPVIAEMPGESTGSWTTFIEKTIPINADTSSLGVQDIFFVISGTDGYWGNLTDEIWFY